MNFFPSLTPKLLAFPYVLLLAACGGSAGHKADTPASREPGTSERRELEPAKISFAMRGSEDTFRKCFMQSIGSRGYVSLRFNIDEQGAVSSTSVEHSSIGKESVGACLIERMNEQRFGEQQEPASGRWTFVFNLTDPIDDKDRDYLLKKADQKRENSFQLLPESHGTIDGGRLDEIVQVNYPLYAHCYRDSIRRRGESRGLLRLRLQIDETGRLVHVDDAGSVLPDPYAVDCMAEAFFAMDLPKPEGGDVVIKYGIDFE